MSIMKRAEDGIWTEASIGRFWDYWSKRLDAHSHYFSYQVGREVVQFAELFGLLRGRVIDYGCGPGFLIAHLLSKSHLRVCGFDTSSKSAEFCNKKYAEFPNFGSVTSEVSRRGTVQKFDVLFCTEVLEH